MEQRRERILIETDRHRIEGTLTLARQGFRSRVSDLLNAAERDFVALTDVTLHELGGSGEGAQHEFMAVSRRHIVFAIPLGDEPADEAA
jgi:hypothetical protein